MTMPCSSMAWSSGILAERPSEIACMPAACGARSGRAVAASRPITASAPPDTAQRIQGRIGQFIVLDKGVEAAELAVMGKRLSPGNVVGRGAGFAGGRENPIVRHVDEFGIR